MRSPLAFFRFLVKAALNQVGFGMAGDLVVEVLPDVARDVWKWWGQGQPEQQLRGEVQAIAVLSDDEARRLAAQAVAEEAKPDEKQERRKAATDFSGSSRVYRGGFWSGSGARCRSAVRRGSLPGDWGNGIAFRVALVAATK
jgi:hypothetical protein